MEISIRKLKCKLIGKEKKYLYICLRKKKHGNDEKIYFFVEKGLTLEIRILAKENVIQTWQNEYRPCHVKSLNSINFCSK